MGDTHHAGRLHGLGHTRRVGLAPEHVALEVLVASIHDEGEGVHVTAHAHEGQETHAAFHQYLLFFFLEGQRKGESGARQTPTTTSDSLPLPASLHAKVIKAQSLMLNS